jgi:hypothetical protein
MLYTLNAGRISMKSFNNYCSDLVVKQNLSRMAKEIHENDYDLETILEGAFEALIKADPDKAEILLEQQRSFMHSLGSGARKVGQFFGNLGKDFMAGIRGEPLVQKALENFLSTIQQAGYDPNMIQDALEQHLTQQKSQGLGPQGQEGRGQRQGQADQSGGAEAAPQGQPQPQVWGPEGQGPGQPASPGYTVHKAPGAKAGPGIGMPGGQTLAQYQAQKAKGPAKRPAAPFGPMPG